MQQEKKLTLQQYIECYNIKKQLRQRSKEKSRSKSRDRAASQPHININPNDNSALSVNRSKQKNKFNSHEQLGKTIYDQVDFRARNLYLELQQAITSIKLQCRGIIRNDKDFAFFIKLMDSVMNKFRAAVMHIHRQNLLLFQMSKQVDKTFSSERDQLTKTHIENLQKSFNQQYNLSKTQYESNLNFVSHKTIKQRMEQNKKGEQLVKTIFGGLSKPPANQKKVTLKVYDGEPKDQKERLQRKQQAVSFLGFIMRNIGSSKKTQQNQPSNQAQSSNPFALEQKNNQGKNRVLSPQPVITANIKNQVPNKPRKQDDKLVKNINYLNTCGKGKINTEDIDKSQDSHNLSFGGDNPQVKKPNQNIKNLVPKSPTKPMQKRNSKGHHGNDNQKDAVKRQIRISEQKNLQKRKSPQVPPSSSQSANRVQLIRRTNTKSKDKQPIRLSATKKPT